VEEIMSSSVADPQIREIVEAFAPWRQLHRRDAWRPLTEQRSRTEAGSQFGGIPLLKAGENWPSCGGCHSPMQLIIQLHLASLPESCPFRSDRECLQLFYCMGPIRNYLEHIDSRVWRCGHGSKTLLAPGKLARVIDIHSSRVAPATVPNGFTPFPCHAVEAWERFDDYPSAADQECLGLQYEYLFKSGRTLTSVEWREGGVRYEGIPEPSNGPGLAESISTAAAKDKVGGWPRWEHGGFYPKCPRCDRSMTYILQIDPQDHVPDGFGKGWGHLTRCDRHPDVLGFIWAESC
jgi:hypothetical protein